MKKLFVLAMLTLSSMFAMAADVLSQSVVEGQVVRSRTLSGNVLTNSVCTVSSSAEGTRSRCVSESRKLTKKQVARAQESFLQARVDSDAERSFVAESAPRTGSSSVSSIQKVKYSQAIGASISRASAINSALESVSTQVR